MSTTPLSVLAHLHMERSYSRDHQEYVTPDVDKPGRQVDIPKLRRGSVGCIFLSLGPPGEYTIDSARSANRVDTNLWPTKRKVFFGAAGIQRMVRGFDAIQRLCVDYPDQLAFTTTTTQVRDAFESGRTAVILHTESLLLDNDLSALRCYYQMGLRVTGLVHAAPSSWIDCDKQQRIPGGLTEFGRSVIAEMNRLGIVIDLSHASQAAIEQVTDQSSDPVIVSHANVRAICPLQRNVTDDTIRRVADGGGVIGIHCSSAMIDYACQTGRDVPPKPGYVKIAGKLAILEQVQRGELDPFQAEADFRAGGEVVAHTYFPTTTVEELLKHVDYLVDKAGLEHVGIGTDLQLLEDVVVGFADAAETPLFLAALARHGYSASDVEKIAGGNFMRVLADVADPAESQV